MRGYLTYALAALAVAWGIVGFLMDWTDGTGAMNAIWAGLTAFGVRRAVANNGTGQ